MVLVIYLIFKNQSVNYLMNGNWLLNGVIILGTKIILNSLLVK